MEGIPISEVKEWYIAIGPNCWGRHTTIDGARKKMQSVFRGSGIYKLKPGYPYVIFRVGEHTHITEPWGHLQYYPEKGDFQPIKVEERKKGCKKEVFSEQAQ